MAAVFGKAVTVAALCGAAALCNGALGQELRDASSDDEVIVVGRIGELRHQLRLAEEALYQRFNDINSTDLFDIHCYSEPLTGSRIQRRYCASNSWREQDANFAQATLAEMRGEMSSTPQQFRGQQLIMQERLIDEMRQLVTEDEALLRAVQRLAMAQLALGEQTGDRPAWTLSRSVPAGENGLPFDAQRMFEVQVSREPWNHRLTHRTFTIAHVFGEIRKLELQCDQGNQRLDYQEGVDWTLPADWTACTLLVSAKRATTFALYEFE